MSENINNLLAKFVHPCVDLESQYYYDDYSIGTQTTYSGSNITVTTLFLDDRKIKKADNCQYQILHKFDIKGNITSDHLDIMQKYSQFIHDVTEKINNGFSLGIKNLIC